MASRRSVVAFSNPPAGAISLPGVKSANRAGKSVLRPVHTDSIATRDDAGYLEGPDFGLPANLERDTAWNAMDWADTAAEDRI